MRAIVPSFFLGGLFLVLLVHCGGQVEGASAPDCPLNVSATCSTGAQCVERFTDCAGPHALTCTCDGSGWKCPQLGPPACIMDQCKVAANGVACTQHGLFCPSLTPSCSKGDGCSCLAGKFVCRQSDCPAPACPPPAEVIEGAACNSLTGCTGYLDCPDDGIFTGTFTCQGGRWHSNATCAVSIDGGGAPD